MGKEITILFLTYQTLGGYFKDPESISQDISNPDATLEKLQQLLQDVFEETSAYSELKIFDLEAVQNKIDAGYADCVTARRNLEATQAAEIAAGIVERRPKKRKRNAAALEAVHAADIAAGLAAVVAGLDVQVSNLVDTVVQKIANMDVEVTHILGLDSLNAYQVASTKVTLGLPLWELIGNKKIIRNALQGLAHTSQSADEMKAKLIDIYDAFNEPGDILGKYILFGEAIIKGDESAQAEAIKSLKDALCQGASDDVANASKAIQIAAGLTLASGLVGKAVATRTAQNLGKVFSEEGLDSGAFTAYPIISARSDIFTTSSLPSKDPFAAWLDTTGTLEVLKICSYREVVEKLNDAMYEQKENLSNYYKCLHKYLSGDD